MSGLRTVVPAATARGSRIGTGTRSAEGPDPSGGHRGPLACALADGHMAGDLACARYRSELGDEDGAETGLRERATRVERATGWERNQARDLGAPQLNALLRARDVRVRLRDRRDQRRRVRMRGVGDEHFGISELDHATQIHHSDATASREV